MANQNQFLAGRILAAIEIKLGVELTPGCINNAATSPQFLDRHLRHVWKDALAHPHLSKMIEEFEPKKARGPSCGEFWLGYYQFKKQSAAGSQTSEAKAAAVRANGRKGGRPRKQE
ncbi:MAG: hypothetical protein AB1631_32045 [Acidobacteriota bacterium]